MKTLCLLVLAALATPSWAQPVAGSMEVRWNAGAPDCAATPQEPLQVHAYEPRTFILRQGPCAHFEANFLYLLVGSDRALLIDSGAIAESARMPLAATVLKLLPDKGGAKLPLVVAHSHGHSDHRAGDAQFADLPSVEVVPAEQGDMQAFFGFGQWPDALARMDLGERTVHVIPAPGHHDAHLLFYDERTELLFSGDFLLPGRLLIDDTAAYRESARRIVDFLETRPVAHVLGGHVELDAAGQVYPRGAQYHPNERRLELGKQDLLALPAALDDFNGFYRSHPNFILVNPMHNLLALAAAAIALLAVVAWGLRRLWRRRRGKLAPPASA